LEPPHATRCPMPTDVRGWAACGLAAGSSPDVGSSSGRPPGQATPAGRARTRSCELASGQARRWPRTLQGVLKSARVACRKCPTGNRRAEVGGDPLVRAVWGRWTSRGARTALAADRRKGHADTLRPHRPLVGLSDPRGVSAKRRRTSAAVAEATGHRPNIDAGRDELRRRIVAKLMQIHVPAEPSAHPGVAVGDRGRPEPRAVVDGCRK
jgi:hypothetical protein